MEAVVLAGGYATRLWPITKERSKMFLPLSDGFVIDRTLEELEQVDRIENVYISTNELFADDFKVLVSERDYDKPEVSVEGTTSENEKLGVVGALAELIEREGIDDDLLIVAGDNLVQFAIKDFLSFFDNVGGPTLAAYDIGSTDEAREYGVIETEGDIVTDFVEKPNDPNSTLISMACYAFPQDSVNKIPEYLDYGNNPDEPGWFIQWLHQQQETYAFSFKGRAFDVGTRQSYLDAVADDLSGGSIIDGNVEHCELAGNVIVMNGADVRYSYLKNTVVFPDAKIISSKVRNSLVDGEVLNETVRSDLHSE